ncbi:cytochrome c-type biogenesis protein CcmH [Ferrimicrobium sp.]|uniref:cytochrome c-type biogenesis protein CcmH n=1 Tax=Ferrimicrobium sp. TaxID=2926050 RepID=UPI0026061858|nr:cytochrome c-type biogenesis protein CcmH [Ferrimicrobium sp.]
MITHVTKPRRILFAWLALVLIAMASVGYAIVNTPSTSTAARIVTLEKEVRCPSCGNLAVYNSKTASSYSIADYIQHQVRAGASNQEIIDSLVASYGDTILMAPPANGVGLLLWLLPVVVGLVLAWEVYRSLSSRTGSQRRRTSALGSAVAIPTTAIDQPSTMRAPRGVDIGPAPSPGGLATERATSLGGVAAMLSPSAADESNREDDVGQPGSDHGSPSMGETTMSRVRRGTGSGADGTPIVRRGRLFSRRLAQIGAALILVGVGALGTLLFTRSNATTAPSLAQQLASGEALAGLGAVKQARSEFQHILATYPSDPTALAYVGWIDFNLAKTKSAKADSIAVLAHAAQLGAYDASAQLYYGLALYYGEDKPIAAVEHLNRFLATHPSKPLVAQAYRLAKPAYLAAHRKIPTTF